MPNRVQVVWLTAGEEVNARAVEKARELHPELAVVTVSEFAAAGARHVPYHPKKTFRENLRRIRAALAGETVSHYHIVAEPRIPLWSLRGIAVLVSGIRLARLEGLGVRGLLGAWVRWHMRREGGVRRWGRRVARPREAVVPVLAKLGLVTARLRRRGPVVEAVSGGDLAEGVAVVIPSRDGLELLRECLPRIQGERPAQIVVVDNGSGDGTAAELTGVELVVEAEALSFARAINVGLQRVRHKRVLLLNNDMLVEVGFLAALEGKFAEGADLFCATAQILFPAGVRREETGKAALRERAGETEFPVRCEVPLEGEDGTWVLYGSGGCSLYDTAKLRELGGLNERLEPAYVEDLDVGFRAWGRGWATVYCAGARVEHRHRSTTGRYFSGEELDRMVQVNYLRFLASAVGDEALFRELWGRAMRRLHLARAEAVLREGVLAPLRLRAAGVPAGGGYGIGEREVLALTNGDVAVFPGLGREAWVAAMGRPVVMIVTPYLPFPLSHGGAVRIYNLMRAARDRFTWVMVAFAEDWRPPAQELLDLCAEVVLVRRVGSHYRGSGGRPDTVEEFDSATFHAAVRAAVRRWRPAIAQLEWTQMAQYAEDCGPAKRVLVEHDITFDLYEQQCAQRPRDGELREQLDRWRTFERRAWASVDAVVTMSGQDAARVEGARMVRAVPNGVDLERFQPSGEAPEKNTLLFIGSFAHEPNRDGLAWFLRCVWPLLRAVSPRLHVIAGNNPPTFDEPGVTVEGFVADVRPAYRRAAVSIAPLLVSAGTNIKIYEAMAMGKRIVSTPAGMNGITAEGVLVAEGAEAFAAAVLRAFEMPEPRYDTARFGWAVSAGELSGLYGELIGGFSG